MARCLVLGANGFIGSHVVDMLVKEGHFVRCFDRYKSNEKNFHEDLVHTELYHGDFLSLASLEKALTDIDYVFHLISTTNPFISEKDPELDIETNVLHSVKLFNLCAEKKIRRVVFASSSAIYGDHPEIEGQISETTSEKPYSPYAIGKLAVENYLRFFKRKHNLDSLVLRISNPFGPRQNILSGQGVIGTFLQHAKDSTPITIYGDGSMVRDYIYIEDVAKVFCLLFDKPTKHHTYNVGSGMGSSVNEIVDIVERVTNHQLQKNYITAPVSYLQRVVLDTSRLTSEFGKYLTMSLEKGIKETWKHIK